MLLVGQQPLPVAMRAPEDPQIHLALAAGPRLTAGPPPTYPPNSDDPPACSSPAVFEGAMKFAGGLDEWDATVGGTQGVLSAPSPCPSPISSCDYNQPPALFLADAASSDDGYYDTWAIALRIENDNNPPELRYITNYIGATREAEHLKCFAECALEGHPYVLIEPVEDGVMRGFGAGATCSPDSSGTASAACLHPGSPYTDSTGGTWQPPTDITCTGNCIFTEDDGATEWCETAGTCQWSAIGGAGPSTQKGLPGTSGAPLIGPGITDARRTPAGGSSVYRYESYCFNAED